MSETNKYFQQYQGFVDGITSNTSKDTNLLIKRIHELENLGISFSEMDTAISGISGEAGEISDLWKKVKFHNKPWDDENKQKMISEAGDMLWYMAKLLKTLDISFEDVIQSNINKLVSRYPGGVFSIEKSENRSENDK